MAFEQKITQNQNLAFKICIGSQENCLKPIELGTVPYAVKSSFASKAQEAYSAVQSAQSHYTHRATADLDLFTNPSIGVGYFDFQTQDKGSLDATLYKNDVKPDNYENGGYLQWAPVNVVKPNLHICGKDDSTNALAFLELLAIHSNMTLVMGDEQINGDLTVIGKSELTNSATISRGLTVKDGSTLNNGANINGGTTTDTLNTTGTSTFTGLMTVNGGMKVNSVTPSTTDLSGNTKINNINFSNDASKTTISGANINIFDSNDCSKTIQFGSSVTCNNKAAFYSDVIFYGDVNISSSNITMPNGSITNAQLAGGITSDKLGDIPASKLTGSIPTSQLSGTIPTSQLSGNFPTSQLSGQIQNSQLAGNISYDKLAGGITNGQLAGSITYDKLAGGITSDKIGTGQIKGGTDTLGASTGNIASKTIYGGASPNGTVSMGNIAAGTITGSATPSGSIVIGNIAAKTISGSNIADKTITSGNIEDNTIGSGKLYLNPTYLSVSNYTCSGLGTDIPGRNNYKFCVSAGMKTNSTACASECQIYSSGVTVTNATCYFVCY
jgi:hypothetical protein